MAIAAQRFNFLDRETNIGIKDFTTISDNAVYNTVDQLTESSMVVNQDKGILNSLQSNLNELTTMIQSNAVADELKVALNSAIDTISAMDLPGVVNDIFTSLKSLDLQGVKDFFGEMLHIGSSFLCDNLDFLKLFMLGYSFNKNILSGLIIALLLSWLDRFCKGSSAQETALSDGRGIMDMMFQPKGVNVTTGNAFSSFTKYYSDHLKANIPIPAIVTFDNPTFMNNIITGNISTSINNLRDSEVSDQGKLNFLSLLDTNLSAYAPGSVEYNNILSARGQLMNTPMVSVTRRDNNIRYSNLSDKFGSFIKNLGSVELQASNLLNLSVVEQGLYDKMASLKTLSQNSSTLQSIPNNGFDGFNFNTVTPALSPDETTYLMGLNTPTDSHRLYDIHPSSEVFLGSI